MGLLELKPHAYILYRDVHGSRDPKDDLLKLWVAHDQELRVKFPDNISALENVRDQLLGPADELKGGEKGGTWSEKSGRGNGNMQGDRCLTYGQSVETHRRIGHPPGNMSQAHRKDDEALNLIKSFKHVSVM